MPRSCQEVQSDLNKIRQQKNEFDGLCNLADQIDYQKNKPEAQQAIEHLEQLRNDINLSGEVLESSLFVTLETAKEIMGDNLIGPEEVKKLYGYEFAPEQMPTINFSRRRLERANELGETLILVVDEQEQEDLEGRKMVPFVLSYRRNFYMFRSDYNRSDANYHYMFQEETPRIGWALIPKRGYLGEERKDILNCLSDSIGYLENKVYAGERLPVKYRLAIQEFRDSFTELAKLAEAKDGKSFLDIFLNLKIVNYLVPTPVELGYLHKTLVEIFSKSVFMENYYFSSERHLDDELFMLDDFSDYSDQSRAECHIQDPFYKNIRLMIAMRF